MSKSKAPQRAILAAVAIGLIAIVFFVFVRIVPSGAQDLLRREGADPRVLGPGVHVVTPGGETIRYPVGRWTYDFPSDPEFRALDARSLETEVGLRIDFDVAAGSADRIHRALGSDLEAALEAALQRIVAARAGTIPGEATAAQRETLRAGVTDALAQVVGDAGLSIVSSALTRWNPVGFDPVDRTLATAAPVRRLIVVGVDGADWTILDPMIESGELPNFARLRQEGASGKLKSIEPLLSPLLWTTMATGMLPEQHGVLSFNVTDPETGNEVPINRLHRRVDALWNFLGDYERTVAIVGWLATHPPEHVHGLMVTDRLGLIAQDHVAARQLQVVDVVSPPDRAASIAPHLVRLGDLTYGDVRSFLKIDQATYETSRDLREGASRSVSNFMSLLAQARTYHATALDVLARDTPDLLAVYFDFVDASCHLFMPAAPPRRPEISDEEYAQFSGAVAAVIQEQDRMLGQILDRRGDAIVMVISDHGFKSGEARLRGRAETWTGQAPLWHRENGIVAFYGDGVETGANLDGATILDVAPTVLALAGLPRAEDMAGRVLTAAFTPAVVEALPTASVASLERRRGDEAQEWEEDPAVSEEIQRKLQALGYVSAAPEVNHWTLGDRYQEQGQYALAISEYQQALQQHPGEARLLNNLASCLERVGRLEEAERTYLQALEADPADVYAMNNLAVFYLNRRAPQRALPWAQKAVQTEDSYTNAFVTLGSALGMLGRFQESEQAFLRAQELDPSDERVKMNLQRLRAAIEQGGGR